MYRIYGLIPKMELRSPIQHLACTPSHLHQTQAKACDSYRLARGGHAKVLQMLGHAQSDPALHLLIVFDAHHPNRVEGICCNAVS